MKNFDIENLERKNSFATPPDFFAEMQNNVLNKTIPQKKEAKIIPLNFENDSIVSYKACTRIFSLYLLGILPVCSFCFIPPGFQ